jgi:hypothetical protein
LTGEKKKIEDKGDKEVKDDSCIPMNSVSLLFFYHIQLTFLKKIILSRGENGCPLPGAKIRIFCVVSKPLRGE